MDIRPRKILSSYDPTIDAICNGELSELNDGLLERRKLGVCGDRSGCDIAWVDETDRLG